MKNYTDWVTKLGVYIVFIHGTQHVATKVNRDHHANLFWDPKISLDLPQFDSPNLHIHMYHDYSGTFEPDGFIAETILDLNEVLNKGNQKKSLQLLNLSNVIGNVNFDIVCQYDINVLQEKPLIEEEKTLNAMKMEAENIDSTPFEVEID